MLTCEKGEQEFSGLALQGSFVDCLVVCWFEKSHASFDHLQRPILIAKKPSHYRVSVAREVTPVSECGGVRRGYCRLLLRVDVGSRIGNAEQTLGEELSSIVKRLVLAGNDVRDAAGAPPGSCAELRRCSL